MLEQGLPRNPAITKLTQSAHVGCRLAWTPDGADKPKILWKGMGNRAGLHDFARVLLDKAWDKSGERLVKKLAVLPKGTVVTVLEFHNIDRDRGRWVPIHTVTL
jgi:hypothetical protein